MVVLPLETGNICIAVSCFSSPMRNIRMRTLIWNMDGNRKDVFFLPAVTKYSGGNELL